MGVEGVAGLGLAVDPGEGVLVEVVHRMLVVEGLEVGRQTAEGLAVGRQEPLVEADLEVDRWGRQVVEDLEVDRP